MNSAFHIFLKMVQNYDENLILKQNYKKKDKIEIYEQFVTLI